jgi:hypothetical protein
MMKYTEIPTDLLVEATNLLPHLGHLFEMADFSGDIELKVTEDQMFRLMPLIKWLHYIEAEWNAELDLRCGDPFCTASRDSN